MGSFSKLLLPLGEGTIAARAVRAAIEFCDPVIVVTGKDGESLRESLEAQGFSGERFIFTPNPNWAEGRVGSLKAGIKALAKNSEGFFLAHADMPFVDPGVYRSLGDAAAARKAAGLPPALLFPSMGGVKGHPVFFPFTFAQELLEAGKGESLKKAVRGLEQACVETTCEGIFEDVDSPEDYKRLLDKYGLAESPGRNGAI
jgi:molybdenum cofactor cytidylyltransferase